jgi:hypothetical protein
LSNSTAEMMSAVEKIVVDNRIKKGGWTARRAKSGCQRPVEAFSERGGARGAGGRRARRLRGGRERRVAAWLARDLPAREPRAARVASVQASGRGREARARSARRKSHGDFASRHDHVATHHPEPPPPGSSPRTPARTPSPARPGETHRPSRPDPGPGTGGSTRRAAPRLP